MFGSLLTGLASGISSLLSVAKVVDNLGAKTTMYGGYGSYPEMMKAKQNSAVTASTPVIEQGTSSDDVGKEALTYSTNTGAVASNDAQDWQNYNQDKLLRWQEYMSNTSHTRETQDLINAGLNPILSANSGAASYSASTTGSTNSMDIAKLNAKTTLEAAKIQANSAANVANIYADASESNTNKQLASSILNTGANLYGGSILGRKSSTTAQSVSDITSHSNSYNVNHNYSHKGTN